MTNKQLAAVARRAAKAIEDETDRSWHNYSCCALMANFPARFDWGPALSRYAHFFGKQRGRVWFGIDTDKANLDRRVIALCFFAAAVETGDA